MQEWPQHLPGGAGRVRCICSYCSNCHWCRWEWCYCCHLPVLMLDTAVPLRRWCWHSSSFLSSSLLPVTAVSAFPWLALPLLVVLWEGALPIIVLLMMMLLVDDAAAQPYLFLLQQLTLVVQVGEMLLLRSSSTGVPQTSPVLVPVQHFLLLALFYFLPLLWQQHSLWSALHPPVLSCTRGHCRSLFCWWCSCCAIT